jgi:hypothetical protein
MMEITKQQLLRYHKRLVPLLLDEAFYGHAGRKGKVGGSVAKKAAGAGAGAGADSEVSVKDIVRWTNSSSATRRIRDAYVAHLNGKSVSAKDKPLLDIGLRLQHAVETGPVSKVKMYRDQRFKDPKELNDFLTSHKVGSTVGLPLISASKNKDWFYGDSRFDRTVFLVIEPGAPHLDMANYIKSKKMDKNINVTYELENESIVSGRFKVTRIQSKSVYPGDSDPKLAKMMEHKVFIKYVGPYGKK